MAKSKRRATGRKRDGGASAAMPHEHDPINWCIAQTSVTRAQKLADVRAEADRQIERRTRHHKLSDHLRLLDAIILAYDDTDPLLRPSVVEPMQFERVRVSKELESLVVAGCAHKGENKLDATRRILVECGVSRRNVGPATGLLSHQDPDGPGKAAERAARVSTQAKREVLMRRETEKAEYRAWLAAGCPPATPPR